MRRPAPEGRSDHETCPAETRLRGLGVTRPSPAAPGASYAPVVIRSGLAPIFGQLPTTEHDQINGLLGGDGDLAAAARLRAISILAVLKQAFDGDLGRVARRQLSDLVAPRRGSRGIPK